MHQLMVEALQGLPDDAVFVLIVDQFEELFTLCIDEAERRAFIDQLLYTSQVLRQSRLCHPDHAQRFL